MQRVNVVGSGSSKGAAVEWMGGGGRGEVPGSSSVAVRSAVAVFVKKMGPEGVAMTNPSMRHMALG